ncbi:hypothetical protein MLD38_034279 [Melastoma candidum]|uniref:Uncharacterized protein n=1 Tax=Melastoma candidum TaxID=119954 RepID=A0ACB9MAS7_9MYRT|nr:hypothetical protein MLD38_034279 [Melastoma candidum]
MEEAKEKWINHYSSSHQILLVVRLLALHSRASDNLKELEELGCTAVIEVDAHTTSKHPLLGAKVIWNIVDLAMEFSLRLVGLVAVELEMYITSVDNAYQL